MIPPVNALAVLVAAASAMVLGFLWYGPLFGKAWIKMMGFSKEDMEKAQKKGMGKTYALSLLCALVTAYVFSHAITFGNAYLNTSGMTAGLTAAFWWWLGFQVPLLMDSQLWEGKSWKLFGLNAGYRLVSLGVMGAILASWM